MSTQEARPTTERIKRRKGTGQFTKGTSGNPAGRPPGSRNQATLLLEALLDGESEKLIRKAIQLAFKGNLHALQLCLDRIYPPRRERPIHLPMPAAQSVQEISAALATVTTAIGEGQITPTEGGALANILAMQADILRPGDCERRLERLERIAAAQNPSDVQPESTNEDVTNS